MKNYEEGEGNCDMGKTKTRRRRRRSTRVGGSAASSSSIVKVNAILFYPTSVAPYASLATWPLISKREDVATQRFHVENEGVRVSKTE